MSRNEGGNTDFMQQSFQNILDMHLLRNGLEFASQSLARNNKARLTAIVVLPFVPVVMVPYKEKLVESLKRDLELKPPGFVSL